MGTTGFRCKSMNILKLYKFTLAGEGGVDCCCRAAVGDAAEILLKGYICKNALWMGQEKLCEYNCTKTMYIKLNRSYVAPETNLTSVTIEGGICVGSKDQVVVDNNTTTTIDRQEGGDEFTIGEWD